MVRNGSLMQQKMTSHKMVPGGAGRLAAVLLAGLVASASAGAQSLLDEENFDTDLNGWTAGGQAGVQVVWDGARGSPSPGSLRLIPPAESTSGESFKAVGQCRPVEPSHVHTVRADVLADLGDRGGTCFAAPVFYGDVDCQGEGSIGGTGDALPGGDWVTRTQAQTSFASSRAMRVELIMSLEPGTGEAACNFDSVRLYQGLVPVPMPALSAGGLLALIGMLGIAATVVVRRFG